MENLTKSELVDKLDAVIKSEFERLLDRIEESSDKELSKFADKLYNQLDDVLFDAKQM